MGTKEYLFERINQPKEFVRRKHSYTISIICSAGDIIPFVYVALFAFQRINFSFGVWYICIWAPLFLFLCSAMVKMTIFDEGKRTVRPKHSYVSKRWRLLQSECSHVSLHLCSVCFLFARLTNTDTRDRLTNAKKFPYCAPRIGTFLSCARSFVRSLE